MIKVEKLIPGGMALVTTPEGKKGFFWNALPGEIITDYVITKNKSHFFEAIATNIKNPSKHRKNPQDECFLSTSPWQVLAYDYELEQKQELIVEIFREQKIFIDKPEIITDYKDYYYRNKMEYALYWDKEQQIILPAFHVRGSHHKKPITSSSIERPELFRKATDIINQLNIDHEEARKYQSLLLRCNQKGDISGGLYENGQPHPTFNNLTDTILGQKYTYSPNGFFQINIPVYEMVLTEIKKHILTDYVLDLYAGVGTIGLSVASGHKLTLVEVDKNAFYELERNCMVNQSATSPTAVLSKSEDALEYINTNQTTILDPPRAGLDSKLVNRLLEVQPKTIIYLSCNPITQARDIKQLLEHYKIKIIKTYNFFPHTPHIENLIVLEKN